MFELFIVWAIMAFVLLVINISLITVYKVKAEMGFVVAGSLLIIPGIVMPFFVSKVRD